MTLNNGAKAIYPHNGSNAILNSQSNFYASVFFWIFTATRIWDRFIISLIKPKFDNLPIVYLRVLDKLESWNCSASSENQNKNNFPFTIYTKQVTQQRIDHQILP